MRRMNNPVTCWFILDAARTHRWLILEQSSQQTSTSAPREEEPRRGNDGNNTKKVMVMKAIKECVKQPSQQMRGGGEVKVILSLTAPGWLWLSLGRLCVSNKGSCMEKDDPGDT